jgi:hypothetical protein
MNDFLSGSFAFALLTRMVKIGKNIHLRVKSMRCYD